MKTLIAIFLFVVSTAAFSQKPPKGMTKIDGFEVSQIIELDATVKYSRETSTIAVSKNRLFVYEIKNLSELEEGSEYRFWLKIEECNGCSTVPSEMLYYTKSVKQIFDEINEIRAKVKAEYPNF